MLIAVPGIKTFIDTFQNKQCCRFIKKAPDPYPVTAPSAFTRQERLSSYGSKLSNPEIEKYGFELYRYSDTQSYTFN
ncbi:hypothetical protein FACS189483_03680 [Spirochaetia bacterium]|nr:hypothetical protein FACS189483_03680 [Spirochaetia bacterium]